MNEGNEVRRARRLRRAVEDLPREMRPARDLWPEIAGRLAEPREARGGGWWRLAAAVALMVGGLAAANLLRPSAPAVAPRLAATPASSPAMAAPHLRQRDGVLHAHNDLITVVSRRRAGLDEPAAAALTTALAELERATADIEAALARSPGDRRLRLALAAAYRREAGWTSRLNRV